MMGSVREAESLCDAGSLLAFGEEAWELFFTKK